jgi:putative ABC transport system permease protein
MFGQTLKIAFHAIIANKMRSFLTMLGIIIGVTSVVIMISIGQGTTTSITNSIGDMGATLLSASISADDVSLTEEEIQQLKSGNTSIADVAPVITSQETLKSGSTTYKTSVVGVTPSFSNVQGVDVQSGRMIAQSDLDWRTNVAVIGTDVATQIFKTYDVIGKKVSFGNRSFTIVGLLEESGSSTKGSNDDRILIPLSTAGRVAGDMGITTFYAKADTEDNVNRVKNILKMYLLQKVGDEDDFKVYSQSEVLDTMEKVSNTMSMMLGGIAAISLLVGGIGIMNIMLVSVTERTREIGIRKAIGAKRGNILAQFLVEACILSMLGGVLGVLCSILGVQIYNSLTSSSISIMWSVVFATIGFCGVIGVVFGGYPAAKASKLLPIEALRYQ